jgi:hypothetical protein
MDSEQIGSSFESFLNDEGIRDEVDAVAQKRVADWQNQQVDESASLSHSAASHGADGAPLNLSVR